MKAIVVDSPELVRVAEVPTPTPGPGEVLVDVTAAGVNRADLLQRRGFYPPPPGASEILGLEVSGTHDGEPVCALLTGGGYAEQVAVPRSQVMPLPPGVDPVAAAGIPEVACTVYSNLAMTAHLQPGEWLLIHGGGSGIGTFAIQWARAIGAHVAVTAGSDEKLARCADLGAEVLINYREQDFVSALPQPADVILDVVGAKYLDRNVRALADGGRLVVIGLQGGVKAELNLGALLSKRGSVIATSLRSRPTAQKAEICEAVVRDVWPLYATGAIRPIIDRVLPLADATEAHRLLADSSHFGKVLLAV
ncbi:MAG: NAD(P)H-quinone oxidoreductase [Micrococcales bacterium]|nr:NAD(P)H-quinone oxidoreductase [Micrococcales bacterium]